MASDYVMVGATPYEEDCAQVGSPDYREKAIAECKRYIERLRAVYGREPTGADLRIKWFPHDFGSYCEVVCHYDENNGPATEYAFNVENGLQRWTSMKAA